MQTQERDVSMIRQRNVTRFVEMWLSLGRDVLAAGGNQHSAEIAEALGLAAAKWAQLLDLEAQLPREQARLAALERGRVPDAEDAYASGEVLAKKDAAHREQVEGLRASIKEMTQQAKAERKALEAYIVKPKSRR
jgi:hypothetical protein